MLAVACAAGTACGKVGYDAPDELEVAEGGSSDGRTPEGGEASARDSSEDVRDAGEGGPISGEDARDAANEPVVGPVDAGPIDARPVDTGAICPTSIATGGPTATPMYGATGGTAYGDICPPGEGIVGYTGSTTNNQPIVVGQLQTICGKLSIAGSSPCQITVSPGTTLPARGTNPRTAPWTERCPSNQVVVGFHGRAGYDLDALGIDCAPLAVSKAGNGVLHGPITSMPTQGGPTGPTFQDGCRPDQLAVGSNLQAGQIVYALGLFCATASLVP
jgi:hypothetical protein